METKTKEPYLKRAMFLTDKGYKDLKKAIFACTITNFSMFIPAAVMMFVIMEIVKPFNQEQVSWTKLWMLFAVGIVGMVIIFFCNKNDYRKTYVASYMESRNTRIALAEHIRKLPMSLFNSKDLTELTTNMMGDVETCEHVLSHVYPQLLANGISVTFISLILALYDWRMALAVFISVPVAFGVIVASRKIQQFLGKRHANAKLEVSEQVQEYIEGIKVIKACNLDGEKAEKLKAALLKMKKLAMETELGSGVFIASAQMILQAGIGLTIFTGTTLMIHGQIQLIPLLAFLLIVTRIYGPINVELQLLPELFYHQIALKRMRTIMEYMPMEGSDTEIQNFEIQFEQVEFGYQKKGEKTIKNITTSFPARSITALVGPSGSGKSTLSRLVTRFWDVDQGRITIGGVDIKSLDPEHLMGYMAFVFQDVVLFNDTIFNNIKIGNRDATFEEVVAAAKAARCEEFILKLPEGYDTILGENGNTLSGGERQRLSIARALLKNAPIVLLDEATASLDPESEESIQEAIGELVKGKTVIVIAHKLRTIEKAAKIIVLDQGRMVEEGTHKTLIQKHGLYHKLYTIQQESMGWSV